MFSDLSLVIILASAILLQNVRGASARQWVFIYVQVLSCEDIVSQTSGGQWYIRAEYSRQWHWLATLTCGIESNRTLKVIYSSDRKMLSTFRLLLWPSLADRVQLSAQIFRLCYGLRERVSRTLRHDRHTEWMTFCTLLRIQA
jgi:hypothetical protein